MNMPSQGESITSSTGIARKANLPNSYATITETCDAVILIFSIHQLLILIIAIIGGINVQDTVTCQITDLKAILEPFIEELPEEHGMHTLVYSQSGGDFLSYGNKKFYFHRDKHRRIICGDIDFPCPGSECNCKKDKFVVALEHGLVATQCKTCQEAGRDHLFILKLEDTVWQDSSNTGGS